ncbi:unnamed protein product [Musa textilis]
MTYEMNFLEHDKYKNHLPKNRKGLKLQTKKYHLSDNSSNDDDDDDDLGLLTIKFNKFIKQESKIKSELKNWRPQKKKKRLKAILDKSSTSEDEDVKCALTAFDYKVRNSTKTPLLYEIT